MARNGQTPEMGPIVVTGATGGVGSLAIDILTRAGYEAHAITGKADQFDYLTGLGAQQCIARTELFWGQRPLETAHWAGAIDNVGGDMLAGLTRVIKPYGNIAICGNAGGIALATWKRPAGSGSSSGSGRSRNPSARASRRESSCSGRSSALASALSVIRTPRGPRVSASSGTTSEAGS